jgi:hypothetical protein
MKRLMFLILIASFFIGSCGSDNGSSGSESVSSVSLASIGLEVEPCVATFTEDYVVIDVFGDEAFTVKTGESFILRSMDDIPSDRMEAEMYYLVEEGAYSFTVEIEGDDSSAFPFESNCEMGKTDSYLGVFRDVVVYSDVELTQEACSLTKGRSVEGYGGGYSLVSQGFPSNAPDLYEVHFDPFFEECGGLASYYVKAPKAKVFGWVTSLIPIQRYIAPQASKASLGFKQK